MKDLPKTESSFQIEVKGKVTGQRYVGDFSCRIPTIRDMSMINKHRALLNAGLEESLDAGTKNIHDMIAYLRYTLTEMPNFWKEADFGFNLYDYNVVEAVHEKVMAFEDQWQKAVWGKNGPETETKAPKAK